MTLIVILGIIIVLLLVVIYNFIIHYVDPMHYPKIMYKDLVPKTGDIIFIRSYNSVNSFITGNKLGHCGIIIVIGKTPYVLELSYPCPYLTSLEDRIKGGEGESYYIRQLINPLPNHVIKNVVPRVLEEAKRIRYTPEFISYYVTSKFNTVDDVCSYTEKEAEAICSTFVIWFLNRLGVLDKHHTEVPGSSNVSWLVDFVGSHRPTHRIKFFPGKIQFRLSDYGSLTWESICNIGSKPRYSSVLWRGVNEN